MNKLFKLQYKWIDPKSTQRWWEMIVHPIPDKVTFDSRIQNEYDRDNEQGYTFQYLITQKQ